VQPRKHGPRLGGLALGLLGVIAVGLAFNGAGAWSLDAAIGWTVAGAWWGVGATAAALAGATSVLAIAGLMKRPPPAVTTA
jgi:hypothetical protein